MPPRTAKSPSRSSRSSANVASKTPEDLEAELAKAREELGLFKTPLVVCQLFAEATGQFLTANVLNSATSRPALTILYPMLSAWLISRLLVPSWYAPPDANCNGDAGGILYGPSLAIYESLWWLILGILSSVGLGTGLHSGIMFLWPFVMSVIINTEKCQSAGFSATYNHPCVMACDPERKNDFSNTFLNTFVLLAPSIVLWGSGTAIGELPPYFITRAAKQAGKRASDFEDELEDARKGTDLISKIKVWTIDFTAKHGFVGILALASWPNAAFDMCGMACGWLEVPFWTFFGATLIGKGVIKVTLQTFVCIFVFGTYFFDTILGVLPSRAIPQFFCNKAGVLQKEKCTMPDVFTAGRKKLMTTFTLQERMTPSKLVGGAGLSHQDVVRKFCVVEIAGAPLCLTATPAWQTATPEQAANAEKYKVVADRIMEALDANKDSKLSVSEIEAIAGFDGKVSLASLDPGTGGLLSAGNLWNAFIAGLICFFIYSIVEQVALMAQAAKDADAVAALEAASASAPLAKCPPSRATGSSSPARSKSPPVARTNKAQSKKTPSSKRKKE